MSEKSKIEWTDATWTPIRARRKDNGKVGVACVKVSPACKNCYAERLNMRNLPVHGTGLPYTVEALNQVEIFLDEEMLLAPLKWRRPRKIFVCSQTDLFGEFVTDELIDRVHAIMALCPQHTFLTLTKRAARMEQYLNAEFVSNRIYRAMIVATPERGVWSWGGYRQMFEHVWRGVTAEDQQRADERIPHLLRTPAAKRFVSVEPMLGPLDLTSLSVHEHGGIEQWNSLDRSEAKDAEIEGACSSVIDWVIVGGESGNGARPMHPDWARSLRDQCQSAGVAFFLKQWGEWVPASIDHGFLESRMPDCGKKITWMGDDARTQSPSCHGLVDPVMAIARVGKKKAGRLLDGREWGEFPV